MTQTHDDEAEVSAEEGRARAHGANRTLGFALAGGAVLMLIAAFAVAILVTHV